MIYNEGGKQEKLNMDEVSYPDYVHQSEPQEDHFALWQKALVIVSSIAGTAITIMIIWWLLHL